MGKPYFVFDFDASAFRKNYTHLLFLTCVEMGLIPKIALTEIDKFYRDYNNRKGSYGAFIKALLEEICEKKRFAGISVSDMGRVCEQLTSRSGYQTHVFWETLFGVVKELGYGTLIITGSPEMAVQSFAEQRGVDYCLATTFVQQDGIYTGEYDDFVTKNKAQALSEFAKEKGVSLHSCIALGDSVQDSEMLNLVGYPIAIHPTIELYGYCREHKIPIVHEKRALIYIDTWEHETKKRIEGDFGSNLFPGRVGEMLQTRLRNQGFLP